MDDKQFTKAVSLIAGFMAYQCAMLTLIYVVLASRL